MALGREVGEGREEAAVSSDVCFAAEKTLCFAHDTTLDTSSRNSEPDSAPLDLVALDLAAGAAMSQSSSSRALRLLEWNLRIASPEKIGGRLRCVKHAV